MMGKRKPTFGRCGASGSLCRAEYLEKICVYGIVIVDTYDVGRTEDALASWLPEVDTYDFGRTEGALASSLDEQLTATWQR
jgi:hypothetical protein